MSRIFVCAQIVPRPAVEIRRLTGWSEATVVHRLNLSKKKY
jgi:hypothetical protein